MKTITAKEANETAHKNEYADIFNAIEDAMSRGSFSTAVFYPVVEEEKQEFINYFGKLGYKIDIEDGYGNYNVALYWGDIIINGSNS